MRSFVTYIDEDLKKFPLWCEIVLNMFKTDHNLNKDNVKDMINSFCDVEGRLKKFSDYLADQLPKEYIAYQPNDDEFLNKENNDKVCNQIAEFIIKHISK